MRLATALEGQPGLEAAHANLMGEVTLTWDDEVTSRDVLLGTLAGARFPRACRGLTDTSGIATSRRPFTIP